MLRILVVEDDADKRQRIGRALVEIDGIDGNGVDHVADVHGARRALREQVYDLLVLDIALPPRADQDVKPEAGVELLDELLGSEGRYRVPGHVVGITAYDDVFRIAAGRFSSRLLTLVHYDATSMDWQWSLQSRVRHILAARETREAAPKEYQCDLAVVCALETPELASIRSLAWSWVPVASSGDHTIYWRGAVETARGLRRVVATTAARKGMVATAIVAMKVVQAFRPRVLAMTGITAGVRGRTNYGDVLVASPVWDWGSGKWRVSDGSSQFDAAPYQSQLPAVIREQMAAIARDGLALAAIRDAWQAPKPAEALAVRVGPVASGATVLADPRQVGLITEQHRELLGIEMEAYAVFAAAEESSEPRPTPLVMKSVVDFGDANKHDEYQAYGAYTSAQALRLFAERYL